MKRFLDRRIALLIAVVLANTIASAQVWVGLGAQYSFPLGQKYRQRNAANAGIDALLLKQVNCCWWYGAILHFSSLRRSNDAPANLQNFEDQTTLGVHLRYYPWQPMRLPFYVGASLSLSDITVSDASTLTPPLPDLTRTGTNALGVNFEAGYLLWYHCNKPYFFDLHTDISASNLLLKSPARPMLSSLSVGLRLYYRL